MREPGRRAASRARQSAYYPGREHPPLHLVHIFGGEGDTDNTQLSPAAVNHHSKPVTGMEPVGRSKCFAGKDLITLSSLGKTSLAEAEAIQERFPPFRNGYQPSGGRLTQSRHVEDHIDDDAGLNRSHAGNATDLIGQPLRCALEAGENIGEAEAGVIVVAGER